jgi:hypothetical protein
MDRRGDIGKIVGRLFFFNLIDKDSKPVLGRQVSIARYPSILNVRIQRFWRYFLSGLPLPINFTPSQGWMDWRRGWPTGSSQQGPNLPFLHLFQGLTNQFGSFKLQVLMGPDVQEQAF